MKQYVKYCIIAFTTILLFNSAVKGAGLFYSSRNKKTVSYFISQAPTTQQTIRNFYNHLSNSTSCLNNEEIVKIPENKSILLPMEYFQTQRLTNSPTSNSLLHLSSHPIPEPLVYYIIGLRKIVI